AEDGIRDRNVTGVQTCALPILNFARRQFLAKRAKFTSRNGNAGTAVQPGAVQPGALQPGGGASLRRTYGPPGRDQGLMDPAQRRSEERRVGKEWVCGGSACG